MVQFNLLNVEFVPGTLLPGDLIFDVDTLVSYISRYITLNPGDVIFTGTPGRTAKMEPGDVVEIEIEGIGILRNTVARAK